MKILELLRKQREGVLAERAAAIAEMETIATTAETEERDALTPEEDAEIVKHTEIVRGIDEKVAALDERIAELEEQATRAAETERRMPKLPVPGASGKPEDIDPTSRYVPASELKARARDLVEKSRIYARSEHQEAVTKLLERSDEVGEYAARLALATGTPEYFRAWSRAMNGQPLTSDDAEQLNKAHELRAMTSGTGSSGGYAVPTPIDPTFIITGAGSTNQFRRLATIVTTVGNTWKGVTAAQVSASYDSEAAEVSDDAPTLTQPSISTAMARAFVPYSVETEYDVPDLVNQLTALIMDAKYNLESSNFATSSTAPKGIMSVVAAVTASRVTPTTGGTYGLPDVYKLYNNLPARHRLNGTANLAWMMNVATISSTRRFGEGTTSNAAFMVDLGAGQPTRLIGAEIVEASAITSTVTTGNDLIVLGDFRKFYIVDKLGMTTERVQNLFHTSNNLPSFQRGFAAFWRTGSDVVDADAFRVLRL